MGYFNKKTLAFLLLFFWGFFGVSVLVDDAFSCTGDWDCEYDVFCEGDNVRVTKYSCSDGSCVAGDTVTPDGGEAEEYNYLFCSDDAIYERQHTCSEDVDGEDACIVEETEELMDLCEGFCEDENGDVYCVNPPSVETYEDPWVAEYEADLEGYLHSLGDNADSADVWFRYGKAGEDLDSTTSSETMTDEGEFGRNVSGLEANTDYDFQAVATNVTGEEVYGDTYSFTTLPDFSVEATGSTPGVFDATLYGELISMGDETEAEVYFEYGEPGNLNNTTAPQTMTSEEDFQRTVSGLSPETQYEFRAVAEGEEESDVSESMFFETEENVVIIEATGVDEGVFDATLHGEVLNMGEEDELEVYFEYGEPGEMNNTTSSQTITEEDVFERSISGLDQSTEYEFRAVAEGEGGAVYSDSLTFETYPHDFSVEAVDADKRSYDATLYGNLEDMGEESEADVYFEYRKAGETDFNETPKETRTNIGSFSEDIFGLEELTQYEFRAVAEGYYETVYSDMISFETMEHILIVEATEVSPGSHDAVFYGEVLNMGDEEAVEVYFEYGEPGDLSNSTSRVELSEEGSFDRNPSGLQPDTQYEFRAVAEGDLDKVYSDIMSFRTEEHRLIVRTREPDIGITDTILRGEVVNLGEEEGPIEVYFRYRKQGGSFRDTFPVEEIDGLGSFSKRIRNLEPDTQYEFRAVAIGDEETDHSELRSFTTLSEGDPLPEREGGWIEIKSGEDSRWIRIDEEGVIEIRYDYEE